MTPFLCPGAGGCQNRLKEVVVISRDSGTLGGALGTVETYTHKNKNSLQVFP